MERNMERNILPDTSQLPGVLILPQKPDNKEQSKKKEETLTCIRPLDNEAGLFPHRKRAGKRHGAAAPLPYSTITIALILPASYNYSAPPASGDKGERT